MNSKSGARRSVGKLSAIALAVALVQTSFVSATQVSSVRYDGLYCTRSHEGYNHYVRFYPDGAVVYAVSTGTPKDVARWLRKHFSYFGGDGSYTVKGNRIQMRTAERDGNVNYSGTVGRERLQLTSYSDATKRGETLQFKFIPIHLVADADRSPSNH